MEYLPIAALAVSILALLIALAARAKAAGQARGVEDARTEARRLANETADELEQKLRVLRQTLCAMRAGAPLTDEMILSGQTYFDVSPEDGKRMVEQGGVRIVDVRTAQEVASGIIPGAVHIPVDQLEDRLGELPKDGKKTLVYCAGGGRSAAACEFLSGQGYANLHNLNGGIGSYTGRVERPK